METEIRLSIGVQHFIAFITLLLTIKMLRKNHRYDNELCFKFLNIFLSEYSHVYLGASELKVQTKLFFLIFS